MFFIQISSVQAEEDYNLSVQYAAKVFMHCELHPLIIVKCYYGW